MGNEGGVHLQNAFERLVGPHTRPHYVIEPLSIAWNAVVFQVSGSRHAVVCVPREELDDFLERLERGALDEAIVAFLDTPAANRILRASTQAGSTGLFDEIAAADSAVPPERAPGRTRPLGGRGGTPREARENKGRRRGRFPRGAVAAVVVAALLVIGGAAVALTGSASSKKSAAPTTTTFAPTTTTTAPADLVAARQLEGQWNVTRTVTASTNPNQPVGDVSVVNYTITKVCASTCTLHLDAPGSLGAHEDADLTFANGTYRGAITGTSPCIANDTGQQLSVDTITGDVAFTPAATGTFTGVLNLALSDDPVCGTGRTLAFTLAGQRV